MSLGQELAGDGHNISQHSCIIRNVNTVCKTIFWCYLSLLILRNTVELCDTQSYYAYLNLFNMKRTQHILTFIASVNPGFSSQNVDTHNYIKAHQIDLSDWVQRSIFTFFPDCGWRLTWLSHNMHALGEILF